MTYDREKLLDTSLHGLLHYKKNYSNQEIFGGKMAVTEPVSIVIPAYNEEAQVAQEIEAIHKVLKEANIEYEIIVVDDSSKDQTSAKAVEAKAKVFRHLNNRGYGASLKTGISEAKYENIIITDADGTYPADRIPEILEHLKEADMVVGERSGKTVQIPLIRKPAKWFLRKLAQFVTGKKVPDLNSGLRAFRKSFVNQYTHLLSDRFSFTTTLTVASLCDDFHIYYLPIDYYKRAGKSKIVPWDFVNFIVLVLRLSMYFNPLKVFVPMFNTCFLLGFGKLIYDVVVGIQKASTMNLPFYTQPIISASALILLLSGLLIMLIGMMSDALSRRITQGRVNSYKTFWKGYILKGDSTYKEKKD